ncbi:hypothetical protein ACQEVF_30365 [Nonomuraea polychroma]|uniref:hypothetical protein n=1 Tax=Nonomuraea polychroma TaxID=46176 RepID=UPI003D8EDDAB
MPAPDLPGVLQTVVDVATFIGAAAVTGFIGNRFDAVARRLFLSVRDRWRARARTSGDALTEEEAVDAATAAAIVAGYEPDDIHRFSAVPQDDGSWLVMLRADGDELRATVPPGDPENARILIV